MNLIQKSLSLKTRRSLTITLSAFILTSNFVLPTLKASANSVQCTYAANEPPSNVRVNPSRNAGVKGAIRAKTSVSVEKQSGEWYYISYPLQGWIHQSQIDKYCYKQIGSTNVNDYGDKYDDVEYQDRQKITYEDLQKSIHYNQLVIKALDNGDYDSAMVMAVESYKLVPRPELLGIINKIYSLGGRLP
jgi:hypothetical protein